MATLSSYALPILISLIAVALLNLNCNAGDIPKTKLTNLQCETLDSLHISFKECRLRMIRRGIPALYVYAHLWRPVNNAMIELALYKKGNSYMPFLLNTSTDFCLLQKKKTQNILVRIIYNFVIEFSNINHTCPFDHDVIFKDLVLTDDKFKLIPLPAGNYMLKLIISTEDMRKVIIKVYFIRAE